MGRLMRDFHCKSASKIQYEELADGVRHFKETEKGRMKSGGHQLCDDRSETETVRLCARQLRNMEIEEKGREGKRKNNNCE